MVAAEGVELSSDEMSQLLSYLKLL
jgi:hypothetical protein